MVESNPLGLDGRPPLNRVAGQMYTFFAAMMELVLSPRSIDAPPTSYPNSLSWLRAL